MSRTTSPCAGLTPPKAAGATAAPLSWGRGRRRSCPACPAPAPAQRPLGGHSCAAPPARSCRETLSPIHSAFKGPLSELGSRANPQPNAGLGKHTGPLFRRRPTCRRSAQLRGQSPRASLAPCPPAPATAEAQAAWEGGGGEGRGRVKEGCGRRRCRPSLGGLPLPQPLPKKGEPFSCLPPGTVRAPANQLCLVARGALQPGLRKVHILGSCPHSRGEACPGV